MTDSGGAATPASDGTCRCGCTTPVRPGSTYRPGHDARHASAVARHLIATGHADQSLMDQLPTAALRAKATAMFERALAARHQVHPAEAPSAAPNPSVASTIPTTRGNGHADAAVPAERLAGHSTEQQDAEAVMRTLLANALGVDLAPSRLHLPGGSYVDLDARCEDPPVLAELWAHQGPPKGAQRNKVLADALKLHHVAAHLAVGHRKILCLADPAAAAPFAARTWYADALRTLHIEVLVVDLPATHRAALLTAQRRQYR